MMGQSKIYPLDPKSILSTYLEHGLYGTGAALTATTLGDEDLFRKEDIYKTQTSQKNPRIRIRKRRLRKESKG